MRFVSKSLYKPKTQFCYLAVVRLNKDAVIKQVTGKTGTFAQFNAYATIEQKPKDISDYHPGASIKLTTKFNKSLAEKLIPWKKGTTLLVAGMLEEDQYTKSKTGKTSFLLNLEFVQPQLDYASAAMEEEIQEKISEYDKNLMGYEPSTPHDATF